MNMDYIEFNATIIPLELGRDILIAELAELGFESFVETNEGVKAYIQLKEFVEERIDKLSVFHNEHFNISFTTNIIPDQNWNAEWENSFNPINVDNRCYIRAPFHNRIDNIEYDIVINPKMSFGTGHHETTYLMIKRLLDIELEGKNVLDMGCGTGVLAILAKMKNARYIQAIDIDQRAYKNAIENTRNNDCNEIEVLLGGAELLTRITFDIVIANINRNILIKDMEKYVQRISKKGTLLLSGFFSVDQKILMDKATSLGLVLTHKEFKNDWTMLQLDKA